MAPFGIKVTIIEPGAYATEFGSPESLRFAAGLEAYTDYKNNFFAGLRSMERGNPAATPAALFAVVDAAQRLRLSARAVVSRKRMGSQPR